MASLRNFFYGFIRRTQHFLNLYKSQHTRHCFRIFVKASGNRLIEGCHLLTCQVNQLTDRELIGTTFLDIWQNNNHEGDEVRTQFYLHITAILFFIINTNHFPIIDFATIRKILDTTHHISLITVTLHTETRILIIKV